MRLTLDDTKYLNRIIHHPSIYPFITDDYAPFVEPKQGRLGETFLKSDLYWVLSPAKGAVFILTPRSFTTYEVHTLILPAHRGRKAVNLGKEATKWFFENSTCEKLISWCPVTNPKAKLYAQLVGFEVDCLLTKSIKLKGELVDQWQVSVEKEKFLCQLSS